MGRDEETAIAVECQEGDWGYRRKSRAWTKGEEGKARNWTKWIVRVGRNRFGPRREKVEEVSEEEQEGSDVKKRRSKVWEG